MRGVPVLTNKLSRFRRWIAAGAAVVLLPGAVCVAAEALRVPEPKPASRADLARPIPSQAPMPAATAQAERLKRINAAKTWGYQLAGLSLEQAKASPYEMLVVDATTGLNTGKPFTRAQVEDLKRMPDGRRRLVISYLSIGEAEDYRADYFSPEYLEEDAPDWLMKENPDWKGNRIIRFCTEGWQKTILGDDRGKNVYGGDESAPLHRLLDLGFDGVYLDRVDVYGEVRKECPASEQRMLDFVTRLAGSARKRDPLFMVILQNAEELLQHEQMIAAIDGIAKESLFYGGDGSQNANPPAQVRASLAHLHRAKTAGRAVFVVDYVTDKGRNGDARRRIEAERFIPYIAPKNLATLWLPGVNF